MSEGDRITQTTLDPWLHFYQTESGALSEARRSTQQGSPATIGSTSWYRQKPSSRLRSGGSSLKNTLYPFFIYVWGFASPVSPQPATLGNSGMT